MIHITEALGYSILVGLFAVLTLQAQRHQSTRGAFVFRESVELLAYALIAAAAFAQCVLVLTRGGFH